MPIGTIADDQGNTRLPEEIREHLHLKKGDRVEYVISPDGKVELRPAPLTARSAFGMLHRPGMKPATVEEMDEAIGRYLAEDDERIQKGRA